MTPNNMIWNGSRFKFGFDRIVILFFQQKYLLLERIPIGNGGSSANGTYLWVGESKKQIDLQLQADLGFSVSGNGVPYVGRAASRRKVASRSKI